MRKFIRDEEGSIMVLFAGMLVVLIAFVGLATDLTIVHMRQNELANLCQLVREERLTYQDTIRYSDEPATDCYKLVERTLRNDNSFDGQIKVYYKEIGDDATGNWNDHKREYKLKVVLTKEYPYFFLKLFGFQTATISQAIEGGQIMGESYPDMIWHPTDKPMMNEYSGSCSSINGGAFQKGDLPADWG